METKFKVGDKIEIVKLPKEFFSRPLIKIGDIGIVIDINMNDYYDHKIKIKTNVYWVKKNMIKVLQEEKPRFHDAQIGDLLWNDELGICKIESIEPSVTYAIVTDKEMITLDGKRFLDSPKATFFYYTPENHYLTERPVDEVDWAKIPMNTQVFVSDSVLVNPKNAVSFFGYVPELEKPFWIFIGMIEEHAEGFRYCKLAEPCKPEWRK